MGALRATGVSGPVSVAFNPKDSGVLASSRGTTVTLWKIDSGSWKAQACHIANRNLTFQEWQLYGQGLCQKTCLELPVHPSVLQYARDLARQGDEAAARALFQRVKDLDHRADLDPGQEVAIARAQGAVMSAQILLRTKPLEALHVYENAEKVSASIITAIDWNNVCWSASTRRLAKEAMIACEKAIKMNPKNPDFYDSRGLARALTGDTQGAITDFQAGLELGLRAVLKPQRQDWIKALQAGQNPFTPDVLKSLGNQ